MSVENKELINALKDLGQKISKDTEEKKNLVRVLRDINTALDNIKNKLGTLEQINKNS